jgi:dipeptide/tripeptide permease
VGTLQNNFLDDGDLRGWSFDSHCWIHRTSEPANAVSRSESVLDGNNLHETPLSTFSIVGLVLLFFGSGSTRAALSALGGNQYKLPEDADKLTFFLTQQVLANRFGGLFGRMFFPILKEDVKCFGMNDCYSLAFGSATIGALLALVIFSFGKSFFIHTKPSGNMVVKVFKCVFVSILGASKSKKGLKTYFKLIERNLRED